MLETAVCRCGAVFTRPRRYKAKYCSVRCVGDALAARHPSRRLDRHGYMLVPAPPGYERRGKQGRMVREHVLIAEQALGRRLRRGEIVHHVNGDKADNRRQNLVVCRQDYHKWLHERMWRLYQREHFGARVLTLARSA